MRFGCQGQGQRRGRNVPMFMYGGFILQFIIMANLYIAKMMGTSVIFGKPSTTFGSQTGGLELAIPGPGVRCGLLFELINVVYDY